MLKMADYDIIVIGAGHAGIEAALASARMGCKTLMLTFAKDSIGRMSCNPAIGGVGKGQLVKEIDALGGEMAKAADASGLQFRILNSSKGAAVHSSRAQIDMRIYQDYMRSVVYNQPGLYTEEGEVKSLIVKDNIVRGVITDKGGEFNAQCVIICPGTFLDGLIHIGLKHTSGGRINEKASTGLADNLKERGFRLLRFKTGTCPRLDKNTIDFRRLKIQEGDNPPVAFSFSTGQIKQKQIPCHITYTNARTHKIILDNISRSPLYAGIIKATGVRYCPSIEDKIVKFPDRQRHQVFLEPQGLDTDEIYPNGISTSLPEDVQAEIIRSIEGLENAKVIRFGYGIEHSVVEPTQLNPALETKLIKNLYLAGQINGTTGYEEAAALGLIAGINAGLRVKNREALILDRSTSYIGVLIDDLTTKGTEEPYRMFTSRVEYRLLLREDNADLRLRKIGFKVGLVNKKDYDLAREKESAIKDGIQFLRQSRVTVAAGLNLRRAATLEEILKRPEVSIGDLKDLDHLKWDIPESALKPIEIEVKYSGFIQRQIKEVGRFQNLEKIRLPAQLDYNSINSLSKEIREKLNKFRPLNLGQASRISGVTPAAISLLMIILRKLDGEKQKLPGA
ncbi:MAG: tRNA uridine-5-carboxymethylaminomethyl(34) synthesis enzyme MnmG [Candidatus Omnitrophota bacterium]